MTKKPQIEKFREKARELGVDENEDKFAETLRKMAHGTPEEQQIATQEMADLLEQKNKNDKTG